MTKTILAAGSGPSYSRWPHWPVWTKLFPMVYSANLVDASGPAAGNKFLYRSVLTRLQNCSPDLILMQWNLGKFDVYVENPQFIDQIINGTGVRNFLVDVHTGKTATAEGYWCSSHDNTVPWKKQYNKLVRTRRGTALDDLDSMINLQNICAKKNIPYRFFLHDTVDHEYFSTDSHIKALYNEVDWSANIFPSVRAMYESHESYSYRLEGTVREFHWVPVADWQYWFVTEKMSALTEELGIVRKNNGDTIKDFCHQKTLECYDKITAK
jgi:hypothetical protein